jgi:hypothetical protein
MPVRTAHSTGRKLDPGSPPIGENRKGLKALLPQGEE